MIDHGFQVAVEVLRTEVTRLSVLFMSLQTELSRIGTLQAERRETDKDWRLEVHETLRRLENMMDDHDKTNGRPHIVSTGAAGIGGGGIVAALIALAKALGWF